MRNDRGGDGDGHQRVRQPAPLHLPAAGPGSARERDQDEDADWEWEPFSFKLLSNRNIEFEKLSPPQYSGEVLLSGTRMPIVESPC